MDKRAIRRTADRLLPSFVKRLLFTVRGQFNQSRSTSDVFSQIYSSGRWGGDGKFDSGTGTGNDSVVDPYLMAIQKEVESLGLSGARFIDLGCGDFRVGRRIIPLSGSYTGVDIVPSLIEHLQQNYGRDSISFRCLNIIEDALPDGEVCFVRQVLQHLSNDQILKILPKLARYKYAFISEHIPNRTKPYTPNIDKPHGPDIRLYWKSGVFLDQPPFSLPASRMREILSVRGTAIWKGEDPGEIVTWVLSGAAE